MSATPARGPARPAEPGGEGTRLRRDLGLLDAVGIGFGAVVGAGIFVVTGVAAGVAGPGLLIGLILAGAAATANALSSAQLAAVYPLSGGTYEYGYRVLSPAAGFAAGWLFLCGKIAAAGTVAIGLSGYLEGVLPGIPTSTVAVAVIVLATLLGYFGIQRTSRVNLVVVTLSVGALVVFAVVAFASFEVANLRPFLPDGVRGALQAAALLFFAFTGYARVATLGEEVRDPGVTIPRAIAGTILGAIVLYIAVAAAALGAVGADSLAGSPAPLLVAAGATRAAWLPPLVAVGGVAAMAGVMLSQLLGLSRMAFAMARRGDLPAALGHVHTRTAVPDRATLLIGAVAAIVAATGTLRGVAAAASFTILLYYAIANVAALRMPRGQKRFPDAVPILGVVACLLLAASLPPMVAVRGLLLLVAGFLFRALRSRLMA